MTYWILRSSFWDDGGVWDDASAWADIEYTPSNQIIASGFILDRHEFYVLRLGADSTLLYDLTTQQWSSWDSAGRNTWRATGTLNWTGILGSGATDLPATEIICGDDTTGVLWALDPEANEDDGPWEDSPSRPYTRIVTGIVPVRGRASPRNSAVSLTTSSRETGAQDPSVQLRISDDNGQTYQDCGTQMVPENFAFGELRWRSLGVVRAPSRVYEFSDTGAVKRIDGADARFNEETE